MSEINKDNSYINSLVGRGTRFDGELTVSGLLRIDGDFTGSIRTEGKVLVGRSGRAKCSIDAGAVIIGGVVKGNISSSGKVVVLSTGMVIGNIKAPSIIVEEGVVLSGRLQVLKEGTAAPRPASDKDTLWKPDFGEEAAEKKPFLWKK